MKIILNLDFEELQKINDIKEIRKEWLKMVRNKYGLSLEFCQKLSNIVFDLLSYQPKAKCVLFDTNDFDFSDLQLDAFHSLNLNHFIKGKNTQDLILLPQMEEVESDIFKQMDRKMIDLENNLLEYVSEDKKEAFRHALENYKNFIFSNSGAIG